MDFWILTLRHGSGQVLIFDRKEGGANASPFSLLRAATRQKIKSHGDLFLAPSLFSVSARS
jgi:hypothetical protein